MKIVMLVANPCAPDARVVRESETAQAAGHDVLVLAHAKPGLPAEERRNGVTYHRIDSALPPLRKARAETTERAPPSPSAAPKSRLRARIRPLLPLTGVLLLDNAHRYARAATAWKPDIVHAHDLQTLLAGAWIARRSGARLVYDSHELETGRNAVYAWYERRLRALYEWVLIKRTDAVITVSDSIADYLAALYGIARPAVVLNAPNVNKGPATGDHVRARLGLGDSVPLAIYVGSVTVHRGIEEGVRALAHAPALHLALIGPRPPQMERKLLDEAAALGIGERLHLVDPVPHETVTAFVRTADVSLVLIQNVCLSYRFCFPNKLLESLLAGVPVIASRLVELEQMVERTGAGLVVDETDPAAIARGALEVARHRARYAPSRDVIDRLSDAYSWQRQGAVLLSVYGRLADASAA
jgi:glycosyltransferase involved in cell wall biosynthesis